MALSSNAIHTIFPYCKNGIWMFDDAKVGVKEEAFVAGADEMIEALVAAVGVKKPEKGFTLQFSHRPFPGFQVRLLKVEGITSPKFGGTWYTLEHPQLGRMEGWLCPVLNLYYPESPRDLYVAVKEKKR